MLYGKIYQKKNYIQRLLSARQTLLTLYDRRLRNTNSPITRLKWPPTSAFTAVSTIQESVLNLRT